MKPWLSVHRNVGGVQEIAAIPVERYGLSQPVSRAMRDDDTLTAACVTMAKAEMARQMAEAGAVSLAGRVEGAEIETRWLAQRDEVERLPESWWQRIRRVLLFRDPPVSVFSVPCAVDDPRATLYLLTLEVPAVRASGLGEGHPWLA